MLFLLGLYLGLTEHFSAPINQIICTTLAYKILWNIEQAMCCWRLGAHPVGKACAMTGFPSTVSLLALVQITPTHQKIYSSIAGVCGSYRVIFGAHPMIGRKIGLVVGVVTLKLEKNISQLVVGSRMPLSRSKA